MTPTTPPAVSEAMREGILHDDVQALIAVAKQKVAERDACISALASEIDRLTGERDEVREAFMRVAEAIGAPASERLDLEVRDRLRAAEADLTRMRAETERLRDRLFALGDQEEVDRYREKQTALSNPEQTDA